MLKLKNKGSYFWWTILVLMVWGGLLMNWVSAVSLKLPIISGISGIIVPCIYCYAIIKSSKFWLNNLKKHDVLLFVLMEAIALANVVVYLNNSNYLDYFSDFVIVVIPCFLIGTKLKIEECEKYFYYISVLSIIIQSLYIMWYGARSSELSEGRETMDVAYRTLPYVLYVTWQALKNLKLINLAIAALGFFFLISLGSRGPLLCVLTFVFLYLLFVRLRLSVWSNIGISGLAIILYLQFDSLLNFTSQLVAQMGLSTRIFTLMENSALADDSGRQFIQQKLMAAMDISPIFGYGLAGDQSVAGAYAHNFALEVIVSFGWIIGVLLLLLITVTLIKSFLSTTNESEKGFWLVLLCCGVVKLFLSSTFLQESYLFLLLGYCSQMINKKRITAKSNIQSDNQLEVRVG